MDDKNGKPAEGRPVNSSAGIMRTVARNIEIGNQQAIEALMQSKGSA